MFQKILIANRGEIACRVMRTAHRLGIRTVAVYSDADAKAPHVSQANEAIYIGPSPATQSYLLSEKILEAATATGAEAIHPGYGFLSENAEFAEACSSAGVVFIGPTAQTIRAMGSKSAAKDLMEAADVPTSPGYQGDDQSLDTFRQEATRIGYPVLLKAVAGGGGKGMRLVERESDIEDALEAARREAKSAFGDDRFLVEKFIERARHLEVQIFGDGKGNVVHFFERDCSVQRRHQKIIEEAPAPNLPDHVRTKLLDAGVAAGKAVSYRGAGTVEFLYDGGENVYFMEMNTRLQVEHPVTEEITGTDLVEWQLRVAAGESLPASQDDIKEYGHAFESRLYAEDPSRDFAPSIGTLSTLQIASSIKRARIDSGVAQGQAITPFYDPMIAKVITHGRTRNEALGVMRQALSNTYVAGLETNTAFLHALASEEDFIEGNVSTRFIEDHQENLFSTPDLEDIALAGWLLWQRARATKVSSDAKVTPWQSLTGWRLNKSSREVFWILHAGEQTSINLSVRDDEFHITLEPAASAAARRDGKALQDVRNFKFTGTSMHDNTVHVSINGQNYRPVIAPHLDHIRVWIDGHHIDIHPTTPLEGNDNQSATGGSLSAPMPGTVTAILKNPGDQAQAGDTLLVMEAMKMEHSIKAPHAGIVKAYRFEPGQQVADGDLLVEFEEEG